MNISKVYRRQLDLVRPEELDFPITVIGAGGIGSWTVLALAKMGCQDITVYDFDRVEDKNIPSQFYKMDQIGRDKVSALRDTVKEFTGIHVRAISKKFQEVRKDNPFPSRVIICAVDTLEERKNIWDMLWQQWAVYPDFHCYIDVRMGGELMRVLTVNPFDNNSVNYYNKKLFNTKVKAHQEPCTARSIVYNTFICGGMIASIVKRFAKKEEVKFDFYFDISQMAVY